MKKILIALAAILASSQFALAYDDGSKTYVYAGVMGVSLSDADVDTSNSGNIGTEQYDTGIGTFVGAGYRFPQSNWKVELEYSNRNNDIDKSPFATNGDVTLKSYAGTANAVYEFNNNAKLTPYLGAGVGIAHITDTDKSDNVIAYQASTGLKFDITEDVEMAVGYRYFATTDPELNYTGAGKTTIPYETHNVELRGILNF